MDELLESISILTNNMHRYSYPREENNGKDIKNSDQNADKQN